MKWQLHTTLRNTLHNLGYPCLEKLGLEVPGNSQHGDYATNIAFLLGKELKTNPIKLSEEIVEKLNLIPEITKNWNCTSISGFINLTRTDESIWEEILGQKNSQFPKVTGKILLEYVSANPTGPLHIGHGRWAVVGDTLRRLLEMTGHQIFTEFYINDAGNQIQKLEDSVNALRCGTPIPLDGYHGAYVEELANLEGNPIDRNLQWQKETLDTFRVSFDNWFSEKTLYQGNLIQDVIQKLGDNKYQLDGALWFRSTQFGDDKDRVLIKSDGTYTYFLVDLAYHYSKHLRGFTHLINIWGADHHGYVLRIKSGMKAIGAYLEDRQIKIIIGQMVNLFREGEPIRMSKRTGEMVTLQEVIDEIGVDATRYFLVEKSTDAHIDFDLAIAIKNSAENPVYYLQYAHARLCNVLNKMGIISPKLDVMELEIPLENAERELLRYALKYSDMVWDAALQLSPNNVSNYALSLAKKINLFYEHCPVMNADKLTQKKRIQILIFAKETLCQCLEILGMTAPQKM